MTSCLSAGLNGEETASLRRPEGAVRVSQPEKGRKEGQKRRWEERTEGICSGLERVYASGWRVWIHPLWFEFPPPPACISMVTSSISFHCRHLCLLSGFEVVLPAAGPSGRFCSFRWPRGSCSRRLFVPPRAEHTDVRCAFTVKQLSLFLHKKHQICSKYIK